MTSKSGTRQLGFRQAFLPSHRSFHIVAFASSVPVVTVGSLRSPWHDHDPCCAWRMKGFRRLKPTYGCSACCVPCGALEVEHGDTALSSRGAALRIRLGDVDVLPCEWSTAGGGASPQGEVHSGSERQCDRLSAAGSLRSRMFHVKRSGRYGGDAVFG